MWTAVRFRVQMFWMKYLKHKVSQNVSVFVPVDLCVGEPVFA